jgi:hypothetical protein
VIYPTRVLLGGDRAGVQFQDFSIKQIVTLLECILSRRRFSEYDLVLYFKCESSPAVYMFKLVKTITIPDRNFRIHAPVSLLLTPGRALGMDHLLRTDNRNQFSSSS